MKKKMYFCTALFILLVLALYGCSQSKSDKDASASELLKDAAAKPQQGISFSETDYFYAEDTEVKITAGKPGKIYYTTDGTDPDQKQTLYKDAIKLIANNDTKANVIKAKAYYNDGTESDTIVHTYFVGKNVLDRFDTLIFSVTTDPDNLYDYENGIFVDGKLRDDYVNEHPGMKIDPDDPANYNIRGKEGEREVYLEVFEPEGQRVIAQKAGIRTYGGWSRAREQKSFKIYARKEYDPDNKKLKYDFFPGLTDTNGKIIDSFKQLVLRNCGNDNGFGFIRDELYQTLAEQAGYQDHEAVRPAAVFVNGEYRGFFWLHEVYGDEYFKDHYGKYQGDFEILEGGELYKNSSSDNDNEDIINEYDNMYETYADMDLTKEANYKKLCKVMDVDNYLSYYALNIYLGNEDWPHNNYRTYRYYTSEGEKYGKAPFDGKWRYLLHDMDFSTGIYGTRADVDNINKYIGSNGEIRQACPLFSKLMQRENCKEIFIKKTLDLMNGAFSPENVSKVLDDMNEERLNELEQTYNKGLLENWVFSDQLPERLQDIKDYASLRAYHILDKYQEFFGLKDTYSLHIPAVGCKIKINSYATDTEFIGSYYTDYATTITAQVPQGKEVDYWIVNGNKIVNTELTVTKDMVTDGKVEVELVMK